MAQAGHAVPAPDRESGVLTVLCALIAMLQSTAVLGLTWPDMAWS